MTTPTIRAALDAFQQAANRGTAVYLSPELVQQLRDALKAEPKGEGPTLDHVNLIGFAFQAPEPGEVGELVNSLTLIGDGMSALNHEVDSWVVARAATLLLEQEAELAALRGVPVAVSERPWEGEVIVRYEFEVLDEHDQTVASGDASTREEADREGRHYLQQYEQDGHGPCTLELRRVEVLNPDATPLPAPQSEEGEWP